MDDDEHRVDPGITESNWTTTFGQLDSESAYFFGNDRESSVLAEFGWNFRPPRAPSGSAGEASSNYAEINPIGGAEEKQETAAAAASSTAAIPSVSSSSTEDLPEKSTASGSSDKAQQETS